VEIMDTKVASRTRAGPALFNEKGLALRPGIAIICAPGSAKALAAPSPDRVGRPSRKPGRASSPLPRDNSHMPSEACLLFCTCPDEVAASAIAERLVEERLAACVNRLPGIHSVYRWQGAIERDTEVLLLIKTARSRVDALTARLRELHPYEVPEIIAVSVTQGLPDYLNWVTQCTSTDS
jgi:periplasmic divalent cation tolerance protein